MPTIYKILPSLDTELIKLLHDFLKEDGGQFHEWEIAVMMPASNAFLHYLAGVNQSLKEDNFVSATANLRGMIEALGTIVYDGTAKLSSDGYKRFLKKGRLPKWDSKNKKWVNLGARETARYAQKVVNKKFDIVKIYDDCCDLLHFSSAHMSFLGGIKPQKDDLENILNIHIGSKDNIPVATQKEIIELSAELAAGLGKCIIAGTEEKKQRSKK